MVLRPFLSFDITVDFGVEDDKAGFQLGNAGTHFLSMRFKHGSALGSGMITLFPHVRIAQHFSDGHAGGFQSP